MKASFQETTVSFRRFLIHLICIAERSREEMERRGRKKRREGEKGRITLPFPLLLLLLSPLSRPPGHPWGLVWRRCSTFGFMFERRGVERGKGDESAWADGEKPAPDSHFVFSPDATRQIGACTRRPPVVVPAPLASFVRTHARTHTRIFARVAANTDGRSHSGDM